MQITVRAGPAERQVTAQCQHMIYAMLQVCIQLLFDTFLGIANAGEVGNGSGLAGSLDCIQHFQVLANVSAACAVGT